MRVSFAQQRRALTCLLELRVQPLTAALLLFIAAIALYSCGGSSAPPLSEDLEWNRAVQSEHLLSSVAASGYGAFCAGTGIRLEGGSSLLTHFSAQGELDWSLRFDSAEHSIYEDFLSSGPGGSVLMTELREAANDHYSLRLRRVDSDGRQRWERSVALPAEDIEFFPGRFVSSSAYRGRWVAGYVGESAAEEGTTPIGVFSFDGDAVLLWSTRLQISSDFDLGSSDLCAEFDEQGNVYLCSDTNARGSFLVLSLDRAGLPRWCRLVTLPGISSDVGSFTCRSLALEPGPGGALFIAGYSEYIVPGSGFDINTSSRPLLISMSQSGELRSALRCDELDGSFDFVQATPAGARCAGRLYDYSPDPDVDGLWCGTFSPEGSLARGFIRSPAPQLPALYGAAASGSQALLFTGSYYPLWEGSAVALKDSRWQPLSPQFRRLDWELETVTLQSSALDLSLRQEELGGQRIPLQDSEPADWLSGVCRIVLP